MPDELNIPPQNVDLFPAFSCKTFYCIVLNGCLDGFLSDIALKFAAWLLLLCFFEAVAATGPKL